MASSADQLFVSDDNYILVDICANLVNKKFNRDLESVIQRAKDAGVKKMIVLGTSLHSTKEALRLTRMHPGTVYCTAGIHPHDAKSWGDDDEALEVLRSVASNPECVAIGECGLDFSKDFSSPECQIQANLRIRTQNVEIIHARMLGDSKTAVITFYGTFVPKYVYYQGGELACYPYKNTVQVCKICQQVGHRTDVCPQPELHVCKICGTLEPTDGHECTPHCATCGEDHLTRDRSCRQRLKPAWHRPKYQKRKPLPKMQQAPQETDDIHRSRRPRWFESEEQEMQFSDHEFPGLEHRARVPRSKSTSRSRSRTRSRSSLRPTKSGMKPPPAPKTNQTHPKSRAVPGQQPAEQPPEARGRCLPALKKGEVVRVKDEAWNRKAQVLGQVAPRSYQVATEDGRRLRRNRRHLLRTREQYREEPVDNESSSSEESDGPTEPELLQCEHSEERRSPCNRSPMDQPPAQVSVPQPALLPQLRRSTRQARPPDRLCYDSNFNQVT
ncbi:hypothetical protein MTO96_035621 [Rhipicephalus appendiculatus]